MRTIFKYPLEITDRQVVMIPDGAKILTVQLQAGTPCLWAIVDPSKPERPRRIQTFGTGHNATAAGMYIATYQTGPLVFHVFEDADAES